MARALRRDQRNSGFTLAEALAAMMFLAIVLPALMQAFQVSGRAAVMAERTRIAGELADSKLTEVILTETWQEGSDSGDFDPDHPGYRWVLTTEGWAEDAMRVVSVEILFTVQGREHSVRVSTLAPETEE